MILKFLICLCSLVMVHQVITNFILHNQNSHWRHGTPCSFHVLQDSVTSKEVDIYSLHMIKILLLTNTHLTFQCDFFGAEYSLQLKPMLTSLHTLSVHEEVIVMCSLYVFAQTNHGWSFSSSVSSVHRN